MQNKYHHGCNVDNNRTWNCKCGHMNTSKAKDGVFKCSACGVEYGVRVVK
jgi:hypothetical protein